MHTAHASKYGIYIYICNPDVEHKLVGCAQPRVECRRQTHSIAQMRNNDSLWHNVIYTRQYLSEYFTRTANVHQEFCKFIGVCLRNGIWFASCSASAGTCLLCMKKLCWFVVASIARQTSIFVLWRICFDIISVRMSTDGGGDETRGAYPVNSVLCKCVSKLSFPQNEIVIIFWLKSLAIKRVRRSQHFLSLLNYTHLNRNISHVFAFAEQIVLYMRMASVTCRGQHFSVVSSRHEGKHKRWLSPVGLPDAMQTNNEDKNANNIERVPCVRCPFLCVLRTCIVQSKNNINIVCVTNPEIHLG